MSAKTSGKKGRSASGKKALPRHVLPKKSKTAHKPLKTHSVHKRHSESGSPKASGIEFCDKCGAIMVPVKSKGGMHLECRSCGAKKMKGAKPIRIFEELKHKKEVVVLEKNETILPKTVITCEKCGNKHAYWWMQHTREADEPPTQFFRCTKCKHVWREYK